MPPIGPALAMMRPASLENGRLWIHTVPGPLIWGEEYALAAEDHRFDRAGADDVEIDVGRHGGDAACIDMQLFASGEFALDDRAADMDERLSVAVEALHDEALAAEQAGHDLSLEVDADRDALGGAQEGVFLRDQRAAQVSELERNDRARIGRSEGDPRLALPLMSELRHE